VLVNTQKQFTATVTGTSQSKRQHWDVNGVASGNGTVGFIDTTGFYHGARERARRRQPLRCTATSLAMAAAMGSASVMVVNPPPPVTITVSPTSASVRVRATRQFTATR